MSGARPDTWMPLYWGDYLRDTGHLSTMEHGAYLLLIGQYWSTGPLPADDTKLARIVRCSLPEWRKIRATVAEFFVERDGHWRHGRIDAEIVRATANQERRSKAGRNAAAKRWQSDGNANRIANALQTDRPSPSPSPSPPHSPDGEIDADDPREGEAGPTAAPATEAARRIEVGHRVVEAMGGDPARWAGDLSIVTAWLNAGYDPDLDILPAVKTVMARKPDGPPKVLKYFTDAIRTAHRNRTADLSEPPGATAPEGHWAATLTPAQIERMNTNIRRLGAIRPSEFEAGTGVPIHDATAEQVDAFTARTSPRQQAAG